MKTFSTHYDCIEELCRVHGKHGLLVSVAGDADDWQEVEKAAPYLLDNDRDLSIKLLHGGFLILLFDTPEERDRHYFLTVGDDGPTKLNPYSGPATVFACTFGPDGRGITENT